METLDKEELNALIVDKARDAWEKKEPVLLSEIGQMREGEVATSAKLFEGRLSQYISKHLSHELLLIKHTRIPPSIGIVVRNNETEGIEDFDELLEKKQAALRASVSLPRLHKSFWAAFRKLLEPGLRRYIILNDQVRFLNLSLAEEAPSGSIEIGPDYIASSDEERDAEIYAKIIRWCNDHKIEIQEFHRSADTDARATGSKGGSPMESTLARILHALDDAELQRITIPMDIVKKLSKM